MTTLPSLKGMWVCKHLLLADPIAAASIGRRWITTAKTKSVGGVLTSSAKTVATLGTWSGFVSQYNMTKQRMLLRNMKRTICLSHDVLQQATPQTILDHMTNDQEFFEEFDKTFISKMINFFL
ncbi:hypothetical protein CR513_37191, partial [Mucuna pruriens]